MSNFNIELIKNSKRIVWPEGWVDNIPLVKHLIEVKKPSIIVELGSHTGNSFCAFLEAVSFLNLSCKVYAIDTWNGDPQAGYYDDDVYTNLKQYTENNYNESAIMIRKYFDEAVSLFDDYSIDILHIDGFHSYESVKNDFETWFPKLKKDGVVLFHDTLVFKEGYGVNKYWNEIKNEFVHFNYEVGLGLGILSLDNQKDSPLNSFLKMIKSNVYIIEYYKLAVEFIFLQNRSRFLQNKLININESNHFKFINFIRSAFGLKKLKL